MRAHLLCIAFVVLASDGFGEREVPGDTAVVGGRFVVFKANLVTRDAGDVEDLPGVRVQRGHDGQALAKFVGPARDRKSGRQVFLKCEPVAGASVEGVRGWRGWEVEEALRGESAVLTSDEVVEIPGGRCGVYPLAEPLEK